jgi:hypothetical protein
VGHLALDRRATMAQIAMRPFDAAAQLASSSSFSPSYASGAHQQARSPPRSWCSAAISSGWPQIQASYFAITPAPVPARCLSAF